MTNFGRLVFVATAVLATTIPAAQASEVDSIFVRAKGGTAFYSNVDPVSTALFGIGLDLGFRMANGFGLVGVAKRNFLGSGTEVFGIGTSTRTEVTSLFLGVIPNYSVTKGIATLSFGLGLGVLSVTTQTDSFTSSTSTSTPEITRSRFALAPTIDADFAIVHGLFAHASIQYVVGLGESPLPGFISPMAGVGYRF